MQSSEQLTKSAGFSERIGKALAGVSHQIGSGFSAKHFSEEMFEGRMDPLIMVDHFVMTMPTFDPHLHAGISAVTVMFEDSDGGFLNRDTLGHNIALQPGDLYWLTAASGAVHEEKPEAGARTHALQIFVNLPRRLKKEPARSLHVAAKDVPVLETPKSRVRVVLGHSGDAAGCKETPEEMTILDGVLATGARFSHLLPAGRHAWIYTLSGSLTLKVANESRNLDAGRATTVVSGPEVEISLEALKNAHFVILAAKPIQEHFVKHGPLVMSSVDDITETLSRYATGHFGQIAD
jgi:redox-sensitive bicupin YhaK (pirin superfamily)